MNYVLHTDQFGFDIYIGDAEPLSDTIKDALVFNSDEDNAEIKLSYYRSLSGLDLKVKEVSGE